ncbi:hypothetical protein EMIHUDRAFT_256732 [Emiliania huxleyi CCMP1516]|uniref:Metallo-beta-lactamase domain-containing protein n=2 Tax=Emiliania huxleyi TaxID=2903 RepID=A0A0D3IRN1_EMIH1|nr:hypothetical protein EMIHUDRAFT_256732 [Emiliania huxleyi CCMP1516]EOD13916.1 hypothetical protein EMIHUDRAFT_256732 [Emiliania huxleyi CCMP1516]|eukprot:XP_005766345.1 hypothetical protein EMIHUDRAFT_256732 [Emiliania huxleyi CCMP1516]
MLRACALPFHARCALPFRSAFRCAHSGRRRGSAPPAPQPFRRGGDRRTADKLRASQKLPHRERPINNQDIGELNLVFLGTASAQATTSRAQQSVALRVQNETWLFDCGGQTQMQMLRAGIAPLSVTRIFISHMHGDHVFGLPAVIAMCANSSMQQVEQM